MSNQDLPPAPPFVRGTYRHYRGAVYEALRLARVESDPGSFLVIYQSAETSETWSRPYADFFSTVNVGGTDYFRFRLEP